MRKSYVLVILLALTFAASSAWAQGFGVYEHGACAMARAGAAVAAPCNDGSAIFFNPGGLAFTTGTQISFGGTVINPRGNFTNDNGTATDLLNRYFPVPNAYFATNMGKVTFGVGLFAPYGLTTDWPETFEGRFLGYRSELKGIYVQPTIAFKANDNVGIGGGVDVSYSSLKLKQHVDLSSQPLGGGLTFANIGVPRGTDFANVVLSGNNIQVGFHVGVQAKLTPDVSFGARYMSRQKVKVDDGTFVGTQINTNRVTPIALGPGIPAGTPLDLILKPQFTGTGALAEQSASTSITFPDQFVVGLAFKVAPKTTIMADYQFVHWALFDQIVINRTNSTTPTIMVENFKNTHGIRGGVDHELNERATLRAGFIYHTGASPDETVTPLLPEGQRDEVTAGIGVKLSKSTGLDFAYQYLFQPDRRGRTVAGTTAADNNGVYSFMSHLFGVSIVFGF